MKFLSWLFNFTGRHRGDILRYEKGKIASRIFYILFMLVLAGATVGVEYWCINLFHENFLYGLLVLIFLFIPLASVSFEYLGLYSYIGFRMFFWGTILSFAKKIDKKRQLENEEIIDIDVDKEKKSEKAHKWIDLFIGILGIVLSIGLLIGLILLFALQYL